jgi:hypothetical protein
MARLYGREWTRAELSRYVGDMAQVAGVRAVAYQDGPELGVRALEFRTGGGLAFTVLADRGMDVGLAEIRGVPVSILTAVGYVHPAYFEAPGMNWLRTFQGGLFVTCGLDTSGFPSYDAGADFGLHGRAAALPARGLSFDADWEGDEFVLRARGRMRQVSVHGEHLQLTREIGARLGENRFTIHDVVENLGTRPEPHMIVYHFNVGFPLLAEGAELVVRPGLDAGRDILTDQDVPDYRQAIAPTPMFAEQVFLHDTTPGPDGRVTAAVVNRDFNGGRGLALAIRYSKDELPYLWQWRCMRERLYVFGVEPSNADIRGRAHNRQQGTLVELAPGERREYHLEVEVADSAEDVTRLAREAGG